MPKTMLELQTAGKQVRLLDTLALLLATKDPTGTAADAVIELRDLISLPMDSKYGAELANNATDSTNDIDITAGSRRDATDTINMIGAASTKRLDAAWAVGSGNGGLFSGSIANATYYVFMIRRPDTGVVDYGFSTSITASDKPANYTYYRRLGSILRTGGAIKGFVQEGDWFMWKTPVNDIEATNPGTSAVTRTLTLPTGVRVQAFMTVMAVSGSVAADNPIGVYISDLSLTDVAVPTNGQGPASVVSYDGGANPQHVGAQVLCFTNTSSQVRSRIAISTANATLRITTNGWVDRRL